VYSDKLNEALKLCTTTEVPTVVKDALFELVQEVQAAKTQAQDMGTNTKKTCRCGKT
jgi:hypothetical protein